jgi:hypothetical protein
LSSLDALHKASETKGSALFKLINSLALKTDEYCELSLYADNAALFDFLMSVTMLDKKHPGSKLAGIVTKLGQMYEKRVEAKSMMTTSLLIKTWVPHSVSPSTAPIPAPAPDKKDHLPKTKQVALVIKTRASELWQRLRSHKKQSLSSFPSERSLRK